MSTGLRWVCLLGLLLTNHMLHHVRAFSADDPSAFLFANEFNEIMNTYETLACYANPLEGGHGSPQASTIKIPMFLVQKTIVEYATRSVPSDKYHDSLRSKLQSTMTIAFDSILFDSFNWLNHRDDVHDSFFGLSFPEDAGALSFLCVEYMAIQHRFNVVLPFHTWIETKLNRRYTSDVLEALAVELERSDLCVRVVLSCVLAANTLVEASAGAPAPPRPRVTAAAIDARTGDVFPAAFADAAPEWQKRGARLWTADVSLPLVWAGGEDAQLRVPELGAFACERWYARHLLTLTDAELTEQTSTSPEAEAPGYAESVRGVLRFIAEQLEATEGRDEGAGGGDGGGDGDGNGGNGD